MYTTRASLLIRIRDARDDAAWADFDAIYRPLLYRYAASRGLDHNAAEDVVQHCLMTISEHIRGFEYDPAKGRFKAWLRTMVGNRVRNYYRDRRENEADSQDFVQAQDREETPDAAFEKIWLEEHLRYCLERIRTTEGDKAFLPFRAYVIEERPVQEVCRQFQLPPDQLYRLKWRLTRCLADMMHDLTGGTE